LCDFLLEEISVLKEKSLMKFEVPEELTQDNQSVPILGKVLMWSFSGIEMPLVDFSELWSNAGLSARSIPSIRTRTTVLRTMQAMELAGFTRKIVENSKETVWVLVSEKIDHDAQDVEFEKSNRLIYNKEAQTFRISDPHFQPTVDALMERFSNSIQTSDIRAAVLNEVKGAGCIAMRDRGGVYFVPPQRFSLIESLQKLCAQLPLGTATLNVYNLFDSRSNQESFQVFKQFEAEFMGDLEEMVAKLAELEGVIMPIGQAEINIHDKTVDLSPQASVTFAAVQAGDKLYFNNGNSQTTVRWVDGARTLYIEAPGAWYQGPFQIERELDTKTRASTWHNRLKEYEQQRVKVQMFADLLNFEAKNYTKKIEALELRVRAQIVGK
jgi:hypothetical protein